MGPFQSSEVLGNRGTHWLWALRARESSSFSTCSAVGELLFIWFTVQLRRSQGKLKKQHRAPVWWCLVTCSSTFAFMFWDTHVCGHWPLSIGAYSWTLSPVVWLGERFSKGRVARSPIEWVPHLGGHFLLGKNQGHSLHLWWDRLYCTGIILPLMLVKTKMCS